MKLKLMIVCGVFALASVTSINAEMAAKVDYPVDYRGWAHVKTLLLQPGHPLADPFEGIHHIYANAAALKGLQGGAYADGAVLVFDLLAAQGGEHAVQEGERKFIGVMQRDAKRFAATGGWGYEGFAGNSKTERMVTDGGKSCYGCHVAQKETHYVFSQWRD